MFTKIDHIKYFREIYLLEERMLTLLTEIIGQLSDSKTKTVLERIHLDEIKHVNMMLEIEKIIKEGSPE